MKASSRRWQPTLPGTSLPPYLALGLMLGGASAAGLLANGVLQLAAILLLAVTAWRPARQPRPEGERSLWVAAGVGALVVLLPLVPLPPPIWANLPGRGFVAQGYDQLGIARPWLPLALDRDRAIVSALALLPPFAIGALVVRATAPARRNAVIALLAVAALSVAIGAAQRSGGLDSPFYFYARTNHGLAVGFFANTNHLATLLLMALPYAVVLAARIHTSEGRRRGLPGRELVPLAVAALLVAGLLINSSTAALGMLGPMLVACAFLYRRGIGQPWPAKAALWCALAFAVILLVVLYGPFRGLFFDKAISVADPTTRRTSMALTLKAAWDAFPIGTGPGSFLPIYPRYEAPDRVLPTFVNHAHNDYAELLLETGLVGVVLVGGFLIWFWRRARDAWLASGENAALARASSAAIMVVVVHSLVDYPLRTSAVAMLFAFAAGLLAGEAAQPPAKPRAAFPSRHLKVE